MAAGRPTKLTPETHARIVQAIQAGNYIETAAAYAGISKNTLYEWLRRGAREKERLASNRRARPQKAEQPYLEFADAVEKALAEAEVRDVVTVLKAADAGQWQAAAWRLERKFPERWGYKVKMQQEISGPEGKPVQVEVVLSCLSEEELRTLEPIARKLEQSAEQ